MVIVNLVLLCFEQWEHLQEEIAVKEKQIKAVEANVIKKIQILKTFFHSVILISPFLFSFRISGRHLKRNLKCRKSSRTKYVTTLIL